MTATLDVPINEVGTRITVPEQLIALPVGATIRHESSGRSFVRVKQGFEYDGQVFDPQWFSLAGSNIVDSIPEVEEPEPEDYDTSDQAADDTLTLARCQQRMQTILRSESRRRLRRTDVADRVLRAGNCPEFDLSPGMAVGQWDEDLKGRLPDGTILTVGSPERPNRYGVWGVHRGAMHYLAGPWTGEPMDGCYIVDVMPGVEPAGWFTAERSVTEQQRINEFRRAIWNAGWSEKQSAGWCDEYEQTMKQRAGLTAAAGSRVSEFLDPAGVRALPEGTVLRFTNVTGSVLMRRDNTSRNPCRTVRIGGSIPGAWANSLEVVYRVGARRMEISVHSAEEADGMPLGTVLSDGGRGYTKEAENVWAYNARPGSRPTRFRTRDFGIEYMHYSEFPHVPAPAQPMF